MRNTKYFDLNIFDEQVELKEGESLPNNPYFLNTLDRNQRAIFESPYFKKRSLALEKWNEVCEETNGILNDFFKEVVGGEFDSKSLGYNPNVFNSGKYWQMFGSLDGVNLSDKEDFDREQYQDQLMNNAFLKSEHGFEILQIGWDLAINTALLSDLMKERRMHGSLYLFEHLIEDRDSLFYPSVTQDFQHRIVNESFWQELFYGHNYPDIPNRNILEKILTTYNSELDVNLAEENLFKAVINKNSHVKDLNSPELVIGTTGRESFSGLSPRAVRNYGQFLEKIYSDIEVYHKIKLEKSVLKPLINSYVDAVNCIDEDDNDYFLDEAERKKLLNLGCVKYCLK